ncbi:MAG: helix-turn-helix domain-containing protein [Candidatus Hadarchaeales archaeon]
MELKEAVDVLGLVLSTEGRDPRPGEIRKAGSAILELVERGVANGKESSFDGCEVEVEIKRALRYLEKEKHRLEGDSLAAASDLKRRLERKLEVCSGEVKGQGDKKYECEVKVDNKAMKEDPDIPAGAEREVDGGHFKADQRLDTIGNLMGGYGFDPQLIRKKRMSLGLKQKDLAKLLGISCSYMSLIENGKVKEPSRKVKERVRAFLEDRASLLSDALFADYASRTDEGEQCAIASARETRNTANNVEGEGGKTVALRRLLEVSLGLEARELELLTRIAEALSRKNK